MSRIVKTEKMEIKNLNKRPDGEQDKKLKNQYAYFEKLIEQLKKKEIPSEITNTINQNIEEVNSFSGSSKDLLKQIRKSKSTIFKLIEQELDLVPKNHYRGRWLAIGIGAFGVPLGVAFGTTQDNMGLIGIGIPIGMVIGMAIGSGKDKKAYAEGKQLDLEAK